jgi:hypothetical protein
MKNRHRTLRESVSIAPDATPADDSFGAEGTETNQAGDVARLGVLVRVTPDLRRALKLAAIQRHTTVQKLMLEAVEVVLNRHDDSPAPTTPAGPEANKNGRQAAPTSAPTSAPTITRVQP